MENIIEHTWWIEKINKEYKIQTVDENTQDYWKWYDYGQTKEKLTPWLEVDWLKKNHTHSWWTDWEQIDYSDILNTPSTSAVTYYQEYNSSFSSWTIAWNHTITCWFEPKRIDIYAVALSWYPWNSEWTMIVNESWNRVQWCKFIDWAYTNFSQINSAKILYIKNTSVSTSWYVSAISSTWFTLTIDNNNWNFYCLITVQW